MKILKRREAPKPPKNWWHNLAFTCPKCQSDLQIEPTDKVMKSRSDQHIIVDCPVCGEPQRLHSPRPVSGQQPGNSEGGAA